MRHAKFQLWSASRCLPTPRLFKCAPVQQSGEGNYGTANVDGRTSNSVCSPGRHRKWAITCVGNRGRHRFGQKAGEPASRWMVRRAYTILRSSSLLAVSPKNAIISRLNAGMSSSVATSYQPVMGHDSLSTHVPPALRMSVLSEGHEVSVRPRAASTSTSVHGP
jgi:hypothetical protein